MIIYKPSKLAFLPIIRFGSKIIWTYLRICPYSIYTWHAWLSKAPFSRIRFISHIYLFFWVLENYVEGLKLSDHWIGNNKIGLFFFFFSFSALFSFLSFIPRFSFQLRLYLAWVAMKVSHCTLRLFKRFRVWACEWIR